LVLFPPLEQAPDQTASRPSVIENVMDRPIGKEALCDDPVATLMPAGVELTVSPDRPVAETVNVAV
jgi:hypothetical protein